MKRARLLLFASLAGCFQVQYLAQQASGQWHLLRSRRRIADVLADPAVDGETRRKLLLALEAHEFGVRVLGLRGGDAYTRYLDTGGAPVAWNLSAAYKDRLEAYSIRFPVTGPVPYLGYFREADARAEMGRLQALGFDTTLRPVAGYSTLGLTSDPVYSSMLEGSDARIVEVMLHEMLHGTIYLAGHTEWNESLAEFVGVQGAALFYERRGDGGAARAVLDEARRSERDEERFAHFLDGVLRSLRALYAEPLPREEKLLRREPLFAQARAEYLRLFPPAPAKKPGWFAREPLNNAVLLGYAAYHGDTPEHRRLYDRAGRDLARFIALYKDAVETERDPIAFLKTR